MAYRSFSFAIVGETDGQSVYWSRTLVSAISRSAVTISLLSESTRGRAPFRSCLARRAPSNTSSKRLGTCSRQSSTVIRAMIHTQLTETGREGNPWSYQARSARIGREARHAESRREAAGGDDGGPRDGRRLVAGQEERDVGDLLGAQAAADRMLRRQLGARLRRQLAEELEHRGFDRAGADAVRADVPTPVLDGDGAGEIDHCRLRGR